MIKMTILESAKKAKINNLYHTEPVPNTATGYNKNFPCCYLITDYGHKYFVSAIDKGLYFIEYLPEYNYIEPFMVWFTLDGDVFTILQAVANDRTYKAKRLLQRFVPITHLIALAIIRDNIVEWKEKNNESK